MDRPDQPAINHGQTRKTRPQALLSAFKINYRRDGASGLILGRGGSSVATEAC